MPRHRPTLCQTRRICLIIYSSIFELVLHSLSLCSSSVRQHRAFRLYPIAGEKQLIDEVNSYTAAGAVNAAELHQREQSVHLAETFRYALRRDVRLPAQTVGEYKNFIEVEVSRDSGQQRRR